MKRKKNRSPKPPRHHKPRQRTADPYAEREAQKYARPIPSREAILEWLSAADQPLSFERLLHDLKL
ncbi:MAG TPA: hypothetical protein VGS99_05700, partial [Gammaproteobacteria bacterium]|nr:hypothetical protein [Gammaproteobacteria bacterium]